MSEQAETVTIPREVYDFLMGMKSLDGVWFGDLHKEFQGAFWWRGILCAAAGWPEHRVLDNASPDTSEGQKI